MSIHFSIFSSCVIKNDSPIIGIKTIFSSYFPLPFLVEIGCRYNFNFLFNMIYLFCFLRIKTKRFYIVICKESCKNKILSSIPKDNNLIFQF